MGPSGKNGKDRRIGKASYGTLTSSRAGKTSGESPTARSRDIDFSSAPAADDFRAAPREPEASDRIYESSDADAPRARDKNERRAEKDEKLLNTDSWVGRQGHTLTYVGLFLFTFTLYFRPYELIPGMSGFTSLAYILAVATLLIYLPAQLASEGRVTALPIEVKCVLFIAFWALATIPLAKDPGLAWDVFNEHLSKVAIIFVVMVNILRTPGRMKGLIWLAIGVGVMLSYEAIMLYRAGSFAVEGYRVAVDFGGMFGNPNDMATHFVIFTPITIALGIATKNKIAKIAYFVSAALLVGGLMVTQSRGGILGLLAAALVLSWKLGRGRRLKVMIIAGIIVAMVLLVAPGNLSVRVMSIFIPALDPVGSSDQRRELLTQSIIVTLRNPLGIGIGNFPIVGSRNLVTHNAYTQVSSELGWLALVAYLVLLVSPLRKLSALQRKTYGRKEYDWIYFVSIGVYAAIAGYMVSSFFASIAFNWYIYFPIAYAICLRRIYQLQENGNTVLETGSTPSSNSPVPSGAW